MGSDITRLMKTCTRCKTDQPLSAFYRGDCWCASCKREYKKAWREENIERVKETKRLRYLENKDAILQANKERYERNKPARLAANKEYSRLHPEYKYEACRRRQAKKRNATPDWADRTAVRAFYKKAKDEGLTVDHIIPLIHPLVCGLHVEFNLQLLPASENYRKQNRYELT